MTVVVLEDLRITEVQADGTSSTDGYVRIENAHDSSVDVTGWTLQDEAGYTYAFTDNYTLTSGGTVRLHTGSGTDSSTDGDLYWGSGSYVWNNSGDTVSLYQPDGTLHTEKTY